jgi:8-oxo-dGTP pyrophosphatase MutT (NUDIX family)
MPDKDFGKFIEDLRGRLQGPLPGLNSQMRMATMRRRIRDGQVEVPPDARKAGVLVLFYRKGGEIYIPFIKRNEYPGVHSGQISFPGGGMEPADGDIIQTALRETEEEIGISRNLVMPIGKLSDLFIPPSNFLVTPVVGYMAATPSFRPDPSEVDRILEVPLMDLLDPGILQEKEITLFPEVRIKVPCFYVDGQVIWGATAMMLCELVDVISPGS